MRREERERQAHFHIHASPVSDTSSSSSLLWKETLFGGSREEATPKRPFFFFLVSHWIGYTDRKSSSLGEHWRLLNGPGYMSKIQEESCIVYTILLLLSDALFLLLLLKQPPKFHLASCLLINLHCSILAEASWVCLPRLRCHPSECSFVPDFRSNCFSQMRMDDVLDQVLLVQNQITAW